MHWKKTRGSAQRYSVVLRRGKEMVGASAMCDPRYARPLVNFFLCSKICHTTDARWLKFELVSDCIYCK